jgi:hypothetical protein
VDGGVDRGVDAMEAVRAARRPRDPATVPAWFDAASGIAEPDGEMVDDVIDDVIDRARATTPPVDRSDPPRREEPVHDPSVCGVCPICIALRTLQESRPDLVRHLGEAARHLAAAARSLMDPAATDPTRPRDQGSPDAAGLRRIHLDADDTDERGDAGPPSDDPEGRP